MDRFDAALLNLVQRDDGRTAESLARDLPLSPSAIARRLRRLRTDGWIERSIALLSPRLTGGRLHALLHIQLHEHTPAAGLDRLRARFPNVLVLKPEPEGAVADDRSYGARVAGRDDLEVLCEFVRHVRVGGAAGEEGAADDEERELLQAALEAGRLAAASA